ncbi:nucleoid-associated protein [Chryseobacterium sp. MA9]|uniref:nucleoid-associated protein n=1 Tax=Chryseobacterium sp. MA9 TaxID=2966625 RepID=UPI0021080C7C|nr:nucleoid-associated protein [Chryseobacterium sp. MA9]UTX50546.1 nucleoid-associated protein [Chryseobacterium sp. MA9]
MSINNINYYNSAISNFIVHRVKNGQLLLSDKETEIVNEEDKDVLIEYSFSSFKFDIKFKFNNYSSGIFQTVKDFFNNSSDFVEFSHTISELMFESSNDAKANDGDIIIINFKNVIISGENEVDCLGIFKAENLDYFLKLRFDGNNVYELLSERGINMAKIDRGCLIFNTESENGYVISVIDNRNKSKSFWYDDFLQVSQITDQYFHTQEALMVYKDYITKQLPQEFEVSKADQADFLNKSINFFKEKEEFKLDEFASEVLGDEHVIESFVNFKTDYEQDMQVNIAEEFPISEAAVKKTQRHFKSIIKLDKNFHIYIHGDRQKIEMGEDDKGKYYRLYFEKEV